MDQAIVVTSPLSRPGATQAGLVYLCTALTRRGAAWELIDLGGTVEFYRAPEALHQPCDSSSWMNAESIRQADWLDDYLPVGRQVGDVALFSAQFSPDLVLHARHSHLLRQERPDVVTAIGGAALTGLRDDQLRLLAEFFDYVLVGYDVDRSGASPKLVINADEAERVRKIFGLYLKLGSLLPVVKELRSRGWLNKAWTTRSGKPRGGKAFDKCGLYGLLTNPIYAGKVKHKDDLFDGEHEAIVSQEQFLKVQAQLQHNGRTGGIDVRNRYGALLKRLLYCKACGRVMVHTFTSRGSKRYRYYTCTHAIKAGRAACPSRSLPAGEVERVVVDQICCIGKDAGLLADVLQQAGKEFQGELSRLEVQYRDLERQLARDNAAMRRLAVQGPADGATAGRIVELNERIKHCETHLVELREQKDAAAGEKLSEDELKAAFEDFDNVWGALSPREQAEVLRLLIARVDYDAERSSIAVTFHPSGIKALAKGQIQEDAA